MAVLDRFNKAISTIGSIKTILGWAGLSGWLAGIAIAVAGAVWAMIIGTSGPVVFMAAFCTFVGGIYLGLVPMAFRALQRLQEVPTRSRPSSDIWQHIPQLKLYEAACLLADIDPNLPIVSQPGDANGWYRALCEAIKNEELERVATSFDSQHIFMILNEQGHWAGGTEYRPHEETVISRESLRNFATKRGIRRVFLQ